MTFPPDFTYPHSKIATAQMAAQVIGTLAPRKRVVVQAGGCSGLWPIALSRYFERVYTCEPDAVNFQCLQANVASIPNIVASQCALGDRRASVGLTRSKPQAGLWQVDGDGDIPMVPLDELIFSNAVDAIVLDVEGYELQALTGAEKLIADNRPLLWFEFLNHESEIEAFLRDHGYSSPKHGIGGDRYSVPKGE